MYCLHIFLYCLPMHLYCLQPDNKSTCCKQYTIRLDVTQHQPSKAQKRLLRKWEQFLAGG
jgi:arginine-tRNA-protein transferase